MIPVASFCGIGGQKSQCFVYVIDPVGISSVLILQREWGHHILTFRVGITL